MQNIMTRVSQLDTRKVCRVHCSQNTITFYDWDKDMYEKTVVYYDKPIRTNGLSLDDALCELEAILGDKVFSIESVYISNNTLLIELKSVIEH